MIFKELDLDGAYLISPEPIGDERGIFARVWCRQEFREHSLADDFVQCNTAFNRSRGTLRGMHFQRTPHREVKLVRCTKGSIFDAIVDLRPDSPTYKQWAGFELSADNRKMLYIPKGFAHGYLTLTDNSEVFYQVSTAYAPQNEGGVRWDDPAFGIHWPAMGPLIISVKDRRWPDYEEINHL
jgi:dTDP-4-dehydrorhamnose 3,5-epimerase